VRARREAECSDKKENTFQVSTLNSLVILARLAWSASIDLGQDDVGANSQ
jgi:hypothetical protein